MGQPTIPPTPSGTDLTGKTIIITGGNAGMGYEAARQFLVLHAYRVILAVRSRSRGQEAVSSLRADSEVKNANPNATIEVFDLDLDDYTSAVSFVQKVKQEVKELDVLLNNGALNIMEFQKGNSGHERVMQVNCYSHLLISLELLPLLRSTATIRGAPTHLTFVGSTVQTMHSLVKNPVSVEETALGHFDDQSIYSRFTRYADSKLVVNVYVRHLAALVPSSEVIVNNLCPGLVTTGLDRQLPSWLKLVMSLYRKIAARDVAEGSRTLIYASTVAGPETHGKFLQHNKIDPGAPYLDELPGKEFSDKIWEESVADVRKANPNLRATL